MLMYKTTSLFRLPSSKRKLVIASEEGALVVALAGGTKKARPCAAVVFPWVFFPQSGEFTNRDLGKKPWESMDLLVMISTIISFFSNNYNPWI